MSYADVYTPSDPEVRGQGFLSNQQRWDSSIQLWTSLWSTVPQIHAIGNHEVEMGAINGAINHTTTNFSYPANYPFQSYSARYPVPVSELYTREDRHSHTKSLKLQK